MKLSSAILSAFLLSSVASAQIDVSNTHNKIEHRVGDVGGSALVENGEQGPLTEGAQTTELGSTIEKPGVLTRTYGSTPFWIALNVVIDLGAGVFVYGLCENNPYWGLGGTALSIVARFLMQ